MRACTPPAKAILASSQRRSAALLFHSSGWQRALGNALLHVRLLVAERDAVGVVGVRRGAVQQDQRDAISLILTTLAWRKQLRSWSFTMPTACMKAYMIVVPTNLKPRFFRSFDSASDYLGSRRDVLPPLRLPCSGLPPVKRQR